MSVGEKASVPAVRLLPSRWMHDRAVNFSLVQLHSCDEARLRQNVSFEHSNLNTAHGIRICPRKRQCHKASELTEW